MLLMQYAIAEKLPTMEWPCLQYTRIFFPIVLMCKYLRFAVRSKQAKLSAQQSESTAAHEFPTF
jgi:hypothetical protein